MQYRRALLDSLHGGQPGNTGIMGGQNPQLQPMPSAGGMQPGMGMPAPSPQPPAPNISKYANRDPNAQWTRQDVRGALEQYGPATRENVDRAIKDNPWLGTQVGTHGGKLKNPRTGEIWDVIGNLSSGQGHWQTLKGTNSGGGGNAPMAEWGSLFGGLDPQLMAGVQPDLGTLTESSPNIQALLKQLQGQ